MAKKYNVKEIGLQVTDIIPFTKENNIENKSGFIIQWESDIGWGEYIIYKEADSPQWKADSEHMDWDENKEFIEELMHLVVAKLKIVD